MQLVRCRLLHVGPFADLTFQFTDDGDRPRPITCVLGSAGTGKSSLLFSLAATRPGHAIVLSRPGAPKTDETPGAITEWLTGEDDPARPHALSVATPGTALERESDDAMQKRRREQTIFERRATEGGFSFSAFPGCRWFSRSPIVLTSPERALGRYDVRATPSFDDATRSDLTRETKQVLSGAALGAAMASKMGQTSAFTRLDDALRVAVTELVGLVGYTYVGADPASLEPLFESSGGRTVAFDELPTSARHLASFVALPLRTLYAAYAQSDPLMHEGVVVIDDVELHQDATTQRALGPALRRALPRVQWIVTTSSPNVAFGCEPHEVIALRRLEASGAVELHTGSMALVH
jgi:hypothetical protein